MAALMPRLERVKDARTGYPDRTLSLDRSPARAYRTGRWDAQMQLIQHQDGDYHNMTATKPHPPRSNPAALHAAGTRLLRQQVWLARWVLLIGTGTISGLSSRQTIAPRD